MDAHEVQALEETPKRRARKARFLLWGGCAVVLLIALGLLMPTLAWTGGSWFELKVRLQDGPAPIRDAKVRVIPWRHVSDAEALEKLDLYFPAVSTDTNGVATMKVRCGAGGGSFLFWRTGRIVVRHELQIERSGYRSITSPLENILGRREWPLSKRSFDIQLQMLRDPKTFEN
jgi:hypothetical protein